MAEISDSQAQEVINTMVQSVVDRKTARTITFADQSVTFESLKETLDFLDQVKQRAAGVRTRYAATSKGI